MPTVTRDKEDSESLSEDDLEERLCVAWSGICRKIPVLLFHAEAVVSKDRNICAVGEKYNLTFKIVRTESRLVRGILVNHGFHEVHPNSNDFNLMWTGSHLKTYLLRTLQDFQKVNHFPKSYELTRKDRLYKNIQRMQQAHGFQNFHIVPQTFVLPAEYQEFCNSFGKDKGPWIIKPVASSRGRGIYLVSSPSQIPLDENILVSRYISNPLVIDEFKFDVRLYVLVTSYDPIIIYIYEEGLARFATVKYDHAVKNIKNQFMHLTNYSVNKKSRDYVSCNDPEVEDYGNKWSMSAMLRYLKQEGKDTTLLMGQIEDLIIKAVLSAEMQIATACKMFVPHRNNCFELYGFDVLIDSNLKPWLLEVNLSPSLACDAPLDLKIKASMISDMFSLVGFVCQDPLLKQMRSDRAGLQPSVKSLGQKTQSAPAISRVSQRPLSATNTEVEEKEKLGDKAETLGLTTEEMKVLRRTQEEHERRGGFIRIFPTPQTWALYSGYLEYKTSMNSMLANKLFHVRLGKASMTLQTRKKLKGNMSLEMEALKTCHAVQYERKLLSLEARRQRQRHLTGHDTTARRKAGRGPSPSSLHDSENENEDSNEGEQQGLQEKREQQTSPARPAHTATQPALREKFQMAQHLPPRINKPKVDLLHILQQGWELSKVQARMAFSTYLHWVQMRLLAESRANTTSAWPEKDNDQMQDLVMRFLKRAASNLQQDIRVVLPSHQLSLPDRRRILSHQLGEFIHCYNKETEQMMKYLEKIKDDDDGCINPNVFQEFILEASENDLEDVLTFYTHKNKSSSVFLGTKCQSSKANGNQEDSNGTGELAKHNTLSNAKENSGASESSEIASKASQAKNEETQECVTKQEDSKTALTLNMINHSNTIRSKNNKYSILSHGGFRKNKTQRGGSVIEIQPQAFFSSEVQNSKSKMRRITEEDLWSNKPHPPVVGNGKALSKIFKVGLAQPEVGSCNTQANVLGSQHASCHPVAVDCEHIHLQHCFPPSVLEPQPQAQPPPYVQPPPHPHAEPQSKPHPSGSSSSTNPVQPSHVMWASSNLRSTGSAATAEVLQRVHYSHSAQPSANGAVIAGTSNSSQINIHSQKLSRPSSAGQVSQKATKPRPGSAGMIKEQNSLSAQAQSNQQAIVSALKTLVEKQAARQHNTSSHISLLTEHLTNLNLANGVFSRGGLILNPGCQPGAARSMHTNTRLSGAVGPRCEAVNAAHCQTACNRATEAGLQQNFQPTIGSYQLQFAIQQQKLQSMQLLDQSRTRHQAILAGHMFAPGAVPRNHVPNNSPYGTQVGQQSQYTLNQKVLPGPQGQPKPQILAQGCTILTPRPPTTMPRDGLSRKAANQRINKSVCVWQTLPESGFQ
ncbi:tubulin polyglutamylase TTLL5 isoform X3 [Electrophorus electricus]|uniref:tubulin polyglutamylase TTLL5 isoform X3 n=1 Tax=Electrophorus electricus TaxID=8005 RepID=UPI0015D067E5|nr:tubulin polyglutamylase TTLL5 isoform X3 [Electrophorus electricus]